MRPVHGNGENLVQEPMVNHHADEGPGSEKGVQVTKSPLIDSGSNIVGQMVVKHFVMLAKKDIGQLVSF
jgi:hypothetical protein